MSPLWMLAAAAAGAFLTLQLPEVVIWTILTHHFWELLETW
jgi:hypothetical protein